MKLIIREYLASLRERNELDALLQDLLSQMGLEVFSKPSTGSRQYGVDIAAFGSIQGEPKKVYLFSVKSGNLGRSDWNSGQIQDLQPSLDEIINTYIPTHLPTKYKNDPIEICICFGGDMKEEVRLNVTSYENTHTTERISFSEWGGEKISDYIEQYLLKEELLPENCHRLLRKSLAMLDEPDISVKHYRQLIESISAKEYTKDKDRLTAIRQLYLCIWILYSWCREADNVEAAFQASEISLLHAWQIVKPHLGKEGKTSQSILQTINAIRALQTQISLDFLQQKIIPHTNNLYALSSATRPSCHLDTNLKLFDILGRIALAGIWSHWYLQMLQPNNLDEDIKAKSLQIRDQYISSIKQMIINNPALNWPYKEDQAIDITLAISFLATDKNNHHYIHSWLFNMVNGSEDFLKQNKCYPCHLSKYHELLEHPQNEEGYKEKVTQGSILYPYIATFAALFGFDDIYEQIQKIKREQLPHCNFQLWYPDETSEEHYYANTDVHGATLCDVPIDESQQSFLDLIFKECEENKNFENLSAITFGFYPIILLASRHHRLPVPPHFLKQFLTTE
jgi:hypothetical protein